MKFSVFFFSSLSLVITCLYLIVLLLRYGKEKVHKIFLLFNISILIWGLGATLLSITRDKNIANIFGRFSCVGVAFMPALGFHMVHTLTNQKNKKFLFFSYIQAVFFNFLIIKTDYIFTSSTNLYRNLFFTPSATKYYPFWFLFWFLIILYSHYLLLKFFLKNKEKGMAADLKYLIFGFSMFFWVGSLNFLNPYQLSAFEYANFGCAIYCLSLTYFIFRHQLLGVEVVYKKSLLYSLLIAALSAIYLICVVFAEWAFRGLFGYRSLVFTLVLTFILAMLFNPLKEKIQAIIDRIFLGKTPQEIAQENKQLKQELERSERLKASGTLALGLAHEIKNPLTTIKTFSEFLPEKFKEEDFVKKFSRLIPSEVERINDIVQRILNFAKPAPANFKETDIRQLIDDTLEFLNSEFLKKKIIVEREFQVPEVKINADQAQMRQVILNIILNAIEAMPEGGKITVSTKMTGENYVAVTIRDTGCGISKENMKNIFNPFFTTKDTGTGLGLAICHQIIENHQGTITAESKIGNGTTFIMTLPISN